MTIYLPKSAIFDGIYFQQVKVLGTGTILLSPHHPAMRAVVRQTHHLSQIKVEKTKFSLWGKLFILFPFFAPAIIRQYLLPSGGK